MTARQVETDVYPSNKLHKSCFFLFCLKDILHWQEIIHQLEQIHYTKQKQKKSVSSQKKTKTLPKKSAQCNTTNKQNKTQSVTANATLKNFS